MITVEKVLFLRNVYLFANMSSRALGRLAGVAEEVVFPAQTNVFSVGDYGDSMFLIVEGEVLIHKGELELARLGRKDYFGEMAVLDGEPRSAGASAVTDCLLLKIKQADFHELLSTHFDATLAVLRTLTRRIRAKEAGGRPTSTLPRPEEKKDGAK